MNATLDPEIREIMEAIHYRPALSIILPIEPHISLKAEMNHMLKIATDKAEQELQQYYPAEECQLILARLRHITADLDIPVKKKGIAIYISPLFEKVFYLDSPVEEKLIVDESFEIRDLLYSAKEDIKFILLILSGLESKVFLGDSTALTPLKSNIPESIYAYVTDTSERVSNFSDMAEHKHIVIDKFLHHIDEELGNLINKYHLPVLVLGAEKIIGQFKKLSKHTTSVIDYIDGNYESFTATELRELINPYIAAWKVKSQNDLPGRMEEAAGQYLLVTGIKQVWKDAHNGKGKLLVVEKNYRFAAQHGPEPDIIEPATEPYDHFLSIRDAVDDVMEKVLADGGDVAFAEDGALDRFDHIALIKYYA